MKIAVFEWEDASLHGQDTKWESDNYDFSLICLLTSGLVVRETKKEITLCMDYSRQQKSYRTTATYPKVCFKKIKYIELPKNWKY